MTAPSGALARPEIDAGPSTGRERSTAVDRAVRSRIATGARCAGREGGVYCWGEGSVTPVLVKELGRSERIASGGPTCALRASGDVACVKSSSRLHELDPRMSKQLGDAVDLATGGQSVCAIRRSGAVVCWGFGYHADSRASTADIPTDVVEIGVNDAVAIAMGASGRACAVRSSGSVTCWAELEAWEHTPPHEVEGITDAVSVTVSERRPGFACALRRTGEVACWGQAGYGELGKGRNGERRPPANVDGIRDAVAVSAGAHHACALLRSGRVRCWGSNERGQLGDGTTTNRDEPVLVDGLTDAISIAAGPEHTCAERASGAVVCWGDNRNGELGNGLATNVDQPHVVPGLEGVVQIAAGAHHTCARHRDGAVSCWGEASGRELDRRTPSRVKGVDDAIDLVSGWRYSCAVRRGGRVSCWNAEAYGAAANARKVVDEDVSGAKRVFARGAFSCIQRDDGEVLCGGDDSDLRIGSGTRGDDRAYRVVPRAKGALDVAAAYHHLCFVRANGSVDCIGRGWSGPDGARRLSSIKDAVAIRATDGFTCALRRTREVVCWAERLAPIRDLRDATDLDVGEEHACAVTRDGAVWCWRPDHSGAFEAAKRVEGVTDAVQVSVGSSHTCVLSSSGRVSCRGSNDYGQIGVGMTELSVRPTQVVGLP